MEDPAPVAPPRPPTRRLPVGVAARWTGALLFLATAFLPVYGCRAHPRQFDAPPAGHERAGFVIQHRDRVPARALATSVRDGWRAEGLGGALHGVWRQRAWYPFLLAPLWLAVLLAARRPGSRASRAAGRALLCVSIAVAVLEAFYLGTDWRGMTAPALRGVEVAVAWLVVCAILFGRPAGSRLADPGAVVSSQALLCAGHALTFPVYDGAAWLLEGYSSSAVLSTILSNYRPGFWLSLAAVSLAAAPLYAPSLARLAGGAREPAARPAPTGAQAPGLPVGADGDLGSLPR
jgi:hypothetical protein